MRREVPHLAFDVRKDEEGSSLIDFCSFSSGRLAIPTLYGFQDQLGPVRGTKSKFDERSTVGRSFTLRTTVGDLAGAQRLRVQLVLELSHFLLLSAALSRPLPSAHRRWVCCLTLSSKLVGPLERVAQHHHEHTLLACTHDAARALSSEVTS